MEHSVKITVLMAVYNGGDFLKASIKSVLSQTYKDFEFLIVNDCSTDDTLQVVKSFDDPRIVVKTNEENLGQTRSLTKGLDLAQGKYIARIDADDIAFPHWLEEQLSFIEKHPEFAVVSANAVVIDENNQVRREYIVPTNPDEMILRALIQSPINHVVSIMDKQVVINNGGYEEKYSIIADYGLWSALLRNGYRLSSSGQVLMGIRVHSRSLSLIDSNKTHLKQWKTIMGENIDYLCRLNIEEEEVDILCRAYYATELLSEEEFDQALTILKKIFTSLMLKSGEAEGLTKKSLCKYVCSISLKRIRVYLNSKNIGLLRNSCKKVFSICGSNKYFFVIYVFSFLGSSSVEFLLKQFENFSAYNASRQYSQVINS